jgi:signal transduction histidine kinase
MEPKRALACGSVGLVGTTFVVPTLPPLLHPSTTAFGRILALVGVAIAAVLVAGAVLLYRSDVGTPGTYRIAGWNLLGVVVLGTVLAVATRYEAATVPPLVAADVIAVSAFAHVLIGYNDVRRIRAEEVAAEREKLAVLNRVVRHNLRTEVQTLTGYAELLAAEVETGSAAAGYADAVRERVRSLGEMHGDLKQAFETLEGDAETETFVLGELLPGLLEEMRVAHPDAVVEPADLPEGRLAVEASPELPAALAELVANAVEHGSQGPRSGAREDGVEHGQTTPRSEAEGTPDPGAAVGDGGGALTVRVGAREGNDGRIALTVADDGPGIPEMERAVVSGETAIDQLNHGQGIGLWFVKWVADRSGGTIEFDDDAEGAAVTLRLDPASA